MLGQRGSRRDTSQGGQTLVEFAMVIPMLMVLLMALLEVGLALNASLAVNRASQHGAHIAASAGNIAGADCLILDAIEGDLSAPNKASNISEVLIERTAMVGNLTYAQQTWRRGGKTDCIKPDGTTVELPYTLTVNGYPESQRCPVLGGCLSLTPARSTVDNIGVTVRYRHDWVTPLNGALDLIAPGGSGGGGGSEGGWSFEQRNIFRIEPTL
ncbi:MAG: TadE/TadG family type IV pilus assembly protein [Chloroflexota bacterium]|nr:TadE/TadG family type IV pilus assembly protein [Chloroflexota bacterium]